MTDNIVHSITGNAFYSEEHIEPTRPQKQKHNRTKCREQRDVFWICEPLGESQTDYSNLYSDCSQRYSTVLLQCAEIRFRLRGNYTRQWYLNDIKNVFCVRWVRTNILSRIRSRSVFTNDSRQHRGIKSGTYAM